MRADQTIKYSTNNYISKMIESITQTTQENLSVLSKKMTNIFLDAFQTIDGSLLDEASKAFSWLQTESKRYLDNTETKFQISTKRDSSSIKSMPSPQPMGPNTSSISHPPMYLSRSSHSPRMHESWPTV